MNQRSVVITGAAGGIGRATVDVFSRQDWYVIGIDRSAYGEGFPTEGRFIQADVAQEEDWREISSQLAGVTDSLDALVNNAAIQVTKPLVDTTVEEWDQVLNANLRSVFLSVKMLFPALQARDGGAVVNV